MRGRCVPSKRRVKRQQRQWTKKGAHLLVQACTKVLNEEWEECFRQQYPGFRPLPAVNPANGCLAQLPHPF